MAIDVMLSIEIIELMENYIARVRPEKHIRPLVDIAYRIENQSILIFELRPKWSEPGNEIIECGGAKATYVKKANLWKVFWKKSDNKWHGYTHCPTVSTLLKFLELTGDDKHCCFWG